MITPQLATRIVFRVSRNRQAARLSDPSVEVVSTSQSMFVMRVLPIIFRLSIPPLSPQSNETLVLDLCLAPASASEDMMGVMLSNMGLTPNYLFVSDLGVRRNGKCAGKQRYQRGESLMGLMICRTLGIFFVCTHVNTPRFFLFCDLACLWRPKIRMNKKDMDSVS